jgi:hypothetical protein
MIRPRLYAMTDYEHVAQFIPTHSSRNLPFAPSNSTESRSY